MSAAEPTPNLLRLIRVIRRKEVQMDDPVTDVVDRFQRLAADQQTRAYMDIETIWKAPQNGGTDTDPKPEYRPLLEWL
jgi:hypothetical protein